MVKIRKSCPEQMIFVTEGARLGSEIFERKSFQRLFNGIDVGEIYMFEQKKNKLRNGRI